MVNNKKKQPRSTMILKILLYFSFQHKKTNLDFKNQMCCLQTEYDEFGDSYHDLATVQSLTLSMDAVAKKGSTDSLDLEELESYLQDFKYFLFRGLRLYLEYGEKEEDKRTLDTALVRFYGASVVHGNSILEQDESSQEQDESGLEKGSPEQVLGNVSHVVFFNPAPDIIHKYKEQN